MKLRLFVLFWFSFSVFHAASQELLFSNLSSEVQIPSQECYKIMQDRQGYIWFSTDNGLCRYGSNQLTVFDGKNGLPEENVYNISEDNTGRLWFTTSDDRILYFAKGRLKEAPFNASYQSLRRENEITPIPYYLNLADPGYSYVVNSLFSAQIDWKQNKVYRLNHQHKGANFLLEKKDGYPFICISHQNMNKGSNILLRNGKRTSMVIFPELYGKMKLWMTPTALCGKTDFVAVYNKLVKVDAELNHVIYDFPARILSLYVDKSNGLWVGVQNHGVYYYPDVSTMRLGHHSLARYSVTGICEDHEHGVWCSTLEKGIFYSKSKYLAGYTSIEGLNRTMTLLKYLDGRLYASSSSEELFRIRNGTIDHFPLPIEKSVIFSDIVRRNNQWILSSKEIMIRTDDGFVFRDRVFQSAIDVVGAYKLAESSDRRLFGIMFRCLFEITGKKMASAVRCNLPYIGRTILNHGRQSLLIGGKQGLYVYNLVSGKSERVNGIPENVTELIRTSNGVVWIITKNDGIFWLAGNKVVDAKKELRLGSSVFFDIAEDMHGTVWAGSNKGLYRFTLQGKTYRSSLYNISNGLPSSEVYKVAADSSLVWFSTFDGLFNLPLNIDLRNDIGPAIHLQELLVNNKKLEKIPQVLRLPHDKNDLRFTFDILSFKNKALNKLQYKLWDGKESDTATVNGNELFLENLSPGTYRLKVYGINNDGVKSTDPQVFYVEIKPPFWFTWWFISLMTLTLIFLVFLIVRLIVRSIRKSEEAKTLINKLMAEYQITALQAQMNPHFIFNAINTIQGYVLEKNEEEAYDYLAKFSLLIRMVLHNSQEKVLLITQELEVLNLYIELEQLRFDNCFDYELQIGEEVDVHEVSIPGMLMQPYIENAIWHGIVNLKNSRRGKLVIAMDQVGDLLHIKISDNGVGREMAKSFRKNIHRSVGMQLTKERFEIIKQLHEYETASITIRDLYDDEDLPAGTQVEIVIPVNIER